MKILKFINSIIKNMIITKQKDINLLLELIDNKPVFIVGCSECATVCHTGGKDEVLEMKKYLEGKKVQVTGWEILDPACHLLNDKRLLRKHQEEIDKSEKIIVLACGNGVQTVAEIINHADVISGTDSLFLGEIKRANDFEKRCDMCGDCLLDIFEGFCPISRCPKHMLNGPCGGSINGKCEIDRELDCVWDIIIKHLKNKKQLTKLKELQEPKDWSKSDEMRRFI